jgi:ammonia channel protein AmtB
VTPGAVGLVIVTSSTSAVPKMVSIADATAVLMMQWAHGYSGCIGVLSIGCHVASRSVAGLSSLSPLRIAVMGRQNS